MCKLPSNNLFQIEAYNARGIRTMDRRRDTFNFLKKRQSKFDMCILGDTHCHLPKEAKDWGKEWSLIKKSSYWSLGTQNQKGIAILLSPKFQNRAKVMNASTDPNGRYVKLIIEVGGLTYRIIGVYAPADAGDRINFIQKLHTVVIDNYDAETIMGGDQNLTMLDELDRVNCVSDQNDKGRIDIKYLAQVHDLEDIYRLRNPNKKKYTYFRDNKASRIDFWLTSASLNNQIEKVDTQYNPYSDHHGIKLTFRTNETKVGKGLWKMNTANILTPEFKDQFAEMWAEWKTQKHLYDDITKWWDLGKIHIKTLANNFSIEKSLMQKCRLEDLESEISYLQNSVSNQAKLNELQNEHRKILTEKAEGARVRSRLKWWEDGERSTKYFHGLEKRNGKSKSWEKILDENKQMIYGTKAVQARQVRFYKDLFTTQNLDDEEANFFLGQPTKKLTDEQKSSLEKDITLEDVANAMKLMKNNKSPGEDGITIEFYKTYFNIIGEDLLEVFQCGLNNRELAYSQYLAVISLLYKKGQREDIRNWRPISLLNVDYKILSKVLAERLKKVLPHIIHSDQRGGVQGRYIGENIRLIEDLLYEIDNLEEEAVIFLQDQEKAFDRVEWNWLFSCLRHYNFGDTFIAWLQTLYKNSLSSIMTNGQQSNYFRVTRGIRQGDSLSALLYIIQLEPLAEKIRQSNQIEGIKLKLRHINNERIEIKCCQYVDDSNSFLRNKNIIERLVYILNRYEKASGSKINLGKTVALTLKGGRDEVINEIKISIGPEKVLGVPIGGKDRNNNDSLWESLIKKLSEKLNIWTTRDLSLQGKTHIIRSIGISKVQYALEMKLIDEKYIKQINQVIWKFLWSGKDIKFSRDICHMPRSLGGLGLVDIQILIKVKRINWIIRVLKQNGDQTWSKLIENYLRCLDSQFKVKFFALKVTDSTDLIDKAKIPLFYKECLKYFQELSRIAKVIEAEELLWCNHKYLLNRKPISFKTWSRDGILCPSHLYSRGILDPVHIASKLTHKAGFFFEFHTIKTIFPFEQAENPNLVDIENHDKLNILEYKFQLPDGSHKALKDLTSKDLYNIFLYNKNPTILTKTYWETYAFPGVTFKWDSWYRYNFENRLTPRKVIDFNWKAFYNLIYMESKLRRMNCSDGICKVCHLETENLEHMLMSCLYRRKIWKLVENVIQCSFGNNYNISKLEALCGILPEDLQNNDISIINMILGMTRYHLYLMRNIMKKEEKYVSFTECYIRLRYYITSHIKLLLISEYTVQDVKDKLNEVLNHIMTTLRNGINEHSINL